MMGDTTGFSVWGLGLRVQGVSGLRVASIVPGRWYWQSGLQLSLSLYIYKYIYIYMYIYICIFPLNPKLYRLNS